MESVVLTGATSFLGRNVLKMLIDNGYMVYALVRKSSEKLNMLPACDRVTYVYGDLEHIESAMEDIECADYFLHFGWDGSGNKGRSDAAIQGKNVDYSKRALRLAEKLGCKKFVFSGSQAEYGMYDGVIDEDTPCVPISEYGKAKLLFGNEAKEYCNGSTMKFIHLRIFSVYGADDRPGTLVDSCVNIFNKGGFLKLGHCSQMWNYLYIDDFVRVIIKFLQIDCKETIYIVAGNETRKLKEYVKKIFELSDGLGQYEFGVGEENPEKSPSLNPNISRVCKELAWRPQVDFEEGIKFIMKTKEIIE